MSHVFSKSVESKTRPSDRRVFGRQPVRSLAYVELGEGNGGIVLNISEGGFAVQAVMSLMEELPSVKLQLAHSEKQIEAKGRIAWTSEFRKLAGVEFVDLSPEALSQIRNWVSLETPGTPGIEKPPVKKTESAAPVTAAPIPVPVEKIAAEPPKIASNSEVKLPDAKRLEEPKPEPAVSAAPPVPTEVSAMPPVAATTAATLAPNARSLPSISLPTDRYGFKPSVPARPTPPSEHATVSNRKRTAALVGAFAIISLTVGWVAGRAGLRRVVGPTTTAENQAVEASNEPAAVPSNISQIEVIDANNQRWLIPYNAPPTELKHNVPDQTRDSPSSKLVGNSAPAQVPPVPSPIRAKSSPADAEPSGPTAAPTFTSREKVSPSAAIPSSRPPASAPRVPARATSAGSSNDGALRPGALVHRVEPAYPTDALAQGIEGTVKLDAVIDQDGTVKSVQPLSGPSALFPAAVHAVSLWRYSPTLLEGRPIQTERQITITFQLTPAQSN